MTRKILFLLTLLVIVSLSAGIVSAQDTTVAVIDLETGEGVSEGMATSLSDYLRAQLFNTQKFTIVTREELEEIFKEHKIQLSGITKKELLKVGQLLGVHKIFTGSIGKVGNTYLITLKMIDVESGKFERIETEECAEYKKDALLVSVRNIANKITGAPVIVTGEPEEKVVKKKPIKIAKARTFSIGCKYKYISIGPPHNVGGEITLAITPNFAIRCEVDYPSLFLYPGILIKFALTPDEEVFLNMRVEMPIDLWRLEICGVDGMGEIEYFPADAFSVYGGGGVGVVFFTSYVSLAYTFEGGVRYYLF